MPLGASKTINYGATEELRGSPFDRGVTVTSSVTGLTTAKFEITSNLPNTLLIYELVGVANSDFTSGVISGTLTTNESGGSILNYTLDVEANYSASNTEFFAKVLSPAETLLASSSNITIEPTPSLLATGGTISELNGWKQHEFTSNSTLTVTGTGPGTVYAYGIGSGGGGDCNK